MSVAADVNDTDEPEIVEKTDTVTVEPDEPEDRGAVGDDDKTPNDRPSRKERRENRMQQERQAREEAERARLAAEERAARQDREIAELRGFVQAQSQRQQGDPRAELNQQITKLENEAETHLERAALARKAGDNDTYRREYSAYNAKMREATKMEVKADMAAELDQRFQGVQQGGITPQHLALRDTVMREFSWIATDAIARDAVDGEIGRIVSSTGRRPDDIAVIRQAATAVAKRLNLGGRTPPTREQQQRYAGTRGAEGGSGGDDASRIVVGKAEEKLAQAAFPQLEKKEAIKAWAKEMAKSRRGSE